VSGYDWHHLSLRRVRSQGTKAPKSLRILCAERRDLHAALMHRRPDCAMQLTDQSDRTGVVRLTVLWAVLTGAYLAVVLYRATALHTALGLSSYAGFSAVAAVWFALIDTVHPHEVLRAGAITALLASITLNAAIISLTFRTDPATSAARVIFTLLLFAGLLTTKFRGPRRRINDKDNE
jgi:hypothetical protein